MNWLSLSTLELTSLWNFGMVDVMKSQVLRLDKVSDRVRKEFGIAGNCLIPDFVDHVAVEEMYTLLSQLKESAHTRNFIMPGIETPRRMRTLGGRFISRTLKELVALYYSDEMKRFIESVVGRKVFPCLHPEEFIVVNYLEGRCQTHGWHLDDPDIALIICIRSPSKGGGKVEMISGFADRQKVTPAELARRISDAEHSGHIKTLQLNDGDAYILHASRVLHRVTELESDLDERIAINLAYAFSQDQEFGDTADFLYGENSTIVNI